MIRVLRPWAETLILALLLTLYGRTFLFQAVRIHTVSMEPTLVRGDRVLVNRMVYGPRHGRWEELLLPMRDPTPGEIVAFRHPEEPQRIPVRRIVAVEEERIEIRQKRLFVEGAGGRRDWGHHEDPRVYPDSPLLDPVFRRRDNLPATTVPDDSVFVLGDNRDRSRDSRFWGAVSRDRIQGRALVVYLSLRPKEVAGDRPSPPGFWRRIRWRRTGYLAR